MEELQWPFTRRPDYIFKGKNCYCYTAWFIVTHLEQMERTLFSRARLRQKMLYGIVHASRHNSPITSRNWNFTDWWCNRKQSDMARAIGSNWESCTEWVRLQIQRRWFTSSRRMQTLCSVHPQKLLFSMVALTEKGCVASGGKGEQNRPRTRRRQLCITAGCMTYSRSGHRRGRTTSWQNRMITNLHSMSYEGPIFLQ